MKKFALLFIFIISFQSAQAELLDQSTQLFFPEKEGKTFDLYQKMPATWWNFFFYNKNKISQEEVCSKLSPIIESDILFSPCTPLAIQKEWLVSWAQGNIFNQAPPSDFPSFEASLNKTLVRMSLPQSADFLDIQRQFPLTDFTKIQKSLGEFYKVEESTSQWTILPVLFNFSPKNTEKTKQIKMVLDQSLQNKTLFPVGPHFGSLDNKELIIHDLKTVMNFGFLLLIALLSYLFITRKKLFFLLIPTLFTSIAISSVVVIYTWGTIHGLTLAFGSGLIGISMDYAFHGWPERHRTQVWKSNTISFLTTFFAFALLSFFSIPLIKQLSLFALSGLTVSFILTFFVSKKIPYDWRPQPARIKPKFNSLKLSFIAIGFLIALFALSLFNAKTDFSLSRMDSTQLENQDVLNLSSQQMNKNQYAFLITKFMGMEPLDSQFQWSKEQSIPYLGATTLLGDQMTLSNNRKSWEKLVCSEKLSSWKASLSPQLLNIFSDYLNSMDCQVLKKLASVPDDQYLNLFVSQDYALSIFRTADSKQKESIINEYPDIFFVSDITQKFPKKLRAEISYFIAFVLLTALIILVFFFKKMAVLTFIPVLGAMAFAFSSHRLTGNPLSFMSFISLIILLGLTLDFGIFCTSCFIWKKPLDNTLGSISLSAMTSLAGFAPLAFCSHPVLRDLGLTISTGILGAFLATYLIYPGLSKKFHGVHNA